jgi:hypothetical protein
MLYFGFFKDGLSAQEIFLYLVCSTGLKKKTFSEMIFK